jgi:hypothetical protein
MVPSLGGGPVVGLGEDCGVAMKRVGISAPGPAAVVDLPPVSAPASTVMPDETGMPFEAMWPTTRRHRLPSGAEYSVVLISPLTL